jgi:hypothetical protein
MKNRNHGNSRNIGWLMQRGKLASQYQAGKGKHSGRTRQNHGNFRPQGIMSYSDMSSDEKSNQ